jgi:hypothetical protein
VGQLTRLDNVVGIVETPRQVADLGHKKRTYVKIVRINGKERTGFLVTVSAPARPPVRKSGNMYVEGKGVPMNTVRFPKIIVAPAI